MRVVGSSVNCLKLARAAASSSAVATFSETMASPTASSVDHARFLLSPPIETDCTRVTAGVGIPASKKNSYSFRPVAWSPPLRRTTSRVGAHKELKALVRRMTAPTVKIRVLDDQDAARPDRNLHSA